MVNFAQMGKMMRQIQKMQEEIQKTQDSLKERTVEATAGGGVVTVVVTGGLEVQEIRIDPEALDPEDVELLQDMVLAAVNEALREAREMVQTEMQRITGGLNLPPLPGMNM